jgi:hypothetical protein
MRYAVQLRALGLIAVCLLLSSGITSAGIPDNGLPDNGVPDNGLPDNGLPDNGLPDNGNSPDALINTPLFFDAPTHAYWVNHPFTAATINDPANPGNPLAVAMIDPFSELVMSYQWQLCHPQGDDATVVDRNGGSHTFHGRIGLCVLASGHGWHLDQPLDFDTARYLSASTITQVNRLQVHNRFSLRGPTSDLSLPGGRGDQLTSMAGSMTSYPYKFGTDQPVEAFGACPSPPPFSTGLAVCGWKPHFVGLGKAGSMVSISADSHGVPLLLQVNLGIHAANPGDPTALAVSGSAGVVNPSVQFTVPTGGTWNVQWAADPRPTSTSLPATIEPPTLSATVVSGGGKLRFPADEVFVFTNREMYATAMLFNLSPGDGNIAPIPGVSAQGQPVADCAPRVDSNGPIIEFCDASVIGSCSPCRRSPGSVVVFPNAHMWLASSWTNAQDYYQLRSCSADLSTCVASFEGFIDANYCGPTDPHCLSANSRTVARHCHVKSVDRDTSSARPYRGNGQKLFDAFGCHIGSAPDTGYGVTTFFANYGTAGACWATNATDPTCQYVKRGH